MSEKNESAQNKLFYDTLFPNGGCFLFKDFKTYAPYKPEIDTLYPFYCLNPMRSFRKDSNIIETRNFVFESDREPLDKQLRAIDVLTDYLTPTAVVFSGSKSYHILYSFDDLPALNKHQYAKARQLLQSKIDNILKVENLVLKFDSAVKDRCRLTRAPGFIRDNVPQRTLILAEALNFGTFTSAEQALILSASKPEARTYKIPAICSTAKFLKNTKELRPLYDFLDKPALWMGPNGNHGLIYKNALWLLDCLSPSPEECRFLFKKVVAYADKVGYSKSDVERAVEQALEFKNLK